MSHGLTMFAVAAVSVWVGFVVVSWLVPALIRALFAVWGVDV